MYDFKLADIGEGLHEGQILKWAVKVGDTVKEGDTLVTIETDKVNAELPSPASGVIVKLGGAEGDTLHVGETVAIIDDGKGGSLPAEEPKKEEPKQEEAGASVVGELTVSSEVIASSNESASSSTSSDRARVLATPAARHLAKELGVDINKLKGSGANGRVMKEDIIAASKGTETAAPAAVVAQPTVKISKDGDVEVVKISKLRKSIVKAMVTSKQIIPHTVLFDEVVVDDLVEMRRVNKERAEKQGIKLTYMAFIIKAVTEALKKFPVFNASFDHENEEIIIKNFMNIGIAVDTPDGLIVPNIKNADQKGIFTLAKELREVADQTIARTVQLSQLQGTTFTITNFGAADVAYGTPIINHPEVAILGVGKLEQKPVVVNGEIKVAHVLPLSIAVDHRIIDGADAGRFLKEVKNLLKDPYLLLFN